MTRGVSSESTGGIGSSYERATAAVYLAALLTNSAGPGLTGPVRHVGAQQKAALDDLEIGFDAGHGQTGLLRLQLKHDLKLTDSTSNANFAAIVADSWHVLLDRHFQHGVDRVGAAAEKIAPDAYYAAMKLGELARLALDGEALKARVQDEGQRGKAVFAAVTILSRRALDRLPTADELLTFWRHFDVLRIETVMARHDGRLRAIDSLRSLVTAADSPEPTTVFAALEAVAGTLNIRGATLDRDQLVEELAEVHGLRLQPVDPRLEPTARTAVAAAAKDAKAWRDHLGVRAVAPIFAPRHPIPPENAGTGPAALGPAFGLDGVEAAFRDHRGVAILGAPGAGKTQSLVQIAEHLLETSTLIPIVHSLAKLALRKAAILDTIAADAPWREIAQVGLDVLANAGRLVLLLDGWNELGPEDRSWAWEALDDLKRLHPAILLGITSRSGTVRPHGTAMRLDLAPFERDRQFAAARLLDGEAGAQALLRARSKAGLRPLLSTPLFLTAILEQAKTGTLPADRDTTIANLVEQARGPDKRREHVRSGLQGQQDALLKDLAWSLMEQQSVAITEAELLKVLNESLAGLRIDGALFTQITAPEALDLLLSDSILAATGDPGARIVTFAHQLLQEWFAAHRVVQLIADGGTRQVSATIIDKINTPFWGTTILFAVERLGRTQADAPLAKIVLASLGIEPFLAAEMLVRLPEAIAVGLDPALGRFANAWFAEDPIRAVRFMLASGRPQFSTRIWDALCSERELLFRLGNHSTLRLSALAGGWGTHFPTLSRQKRRTLLIDLVEQGEADALDLVAELLADEEDAELVSSVIDYLDFHVERDHLNHLVTNLGDATGVEIARSSQPNCLSEENVRRWQGWRRARAHNAEGGEWIRLALEFDSAAPETIAEATLTIKLDNHWAAAQLYEAVAARHAEPFAAALAARVRRGETIPYGTRHYLRPGNGPQPDLINLALDPAGKWNARGDIAQLLSPADLAAMLAELLAPSEQRYPRREKRGGAIADTLEHAPLPSLIDAVLATPPANARDAAIVVDVLAGWKSDDDDRPYLPLASSRRMRLETEVRRWTAMLIADPEVARFDLVDAAQLIGRMGRDTLLGELLTLWDADRERQVEQQRAVDEARESAGHSEFRTSYEVQYREALVRIGSAKVTNAMIERLADSGRERDAAIVLGQIHVVDPKPRDSFGPGHNELYARRAALGERSGQSPDATAKLILNRIDALVATREADAIGQAMALAGPALHMNYGNRIRSLRALFDVGRGQARLRDFARVYGERGELIPAAVVREAIDAEAARLEAKDWVPDDEYHRLNDWLRLVAFSDDPAAALPDLQTLPNRYDRENSLGDLAFGLGFSPAPSALEALRMLQEADPSLLFGSRWAASLHELGGDAAAKLLLDALAALTDDPKQWRDTYIMHHALAALIKSPVPRARAFAMLEQASFPRRQALLVHALVEHMGEDDAIALLDLADRPERATIARELIGRLENAAVTRTPIEGTDSMVELDAAPLPRFRRHAFAALDTEEPRSLWAAQCLQALDHLRDSYGKPWAETNHPAIETLKPWPRAARDAWEKLELIT